MSTKFISITMVLFFLSQSVGCSLIQTENEGQSAAQIRARIEDRTDGACKLISKGMTRSEVVSLLGKPDAGDGWMSSGKVLIYGTTHIYFDHNGLVEHVYVCSSRR